MTKKGYRIGPFVIYEEKEKDISLTQTVLKFMSIRETYDANFLINVNISNINPKERFLIFYEYMLSSLRNG